MQQQWPEQVAMPIMKLSISSRCLLLLGLGSVFGAILAGVGLTFWAIGVLIIFASASLLYGLGALSQQVERLGSEEMKAGFSEQTNDIRCASGQSVANNHAAVLIGSRYPGLSMPVTSFSMEPVNLLSLLNLLDSHMPETVVELGSGYSTLVVAAWMREQGTGKVVSFDHDRDWAEITRFYLQKHGLRRFAYVHCAGLSRQACLGHELNWYTIAEEALTALPTVDLLVVDGPPAGEPGAHLSRLPAMICFYDRLAEDAVIFLDDGNRAGEIEVVKIWSERYSDFIARNFHSLSGYWLLRRQPNRLDYRQWRIF